MRLAGDRSKCIRARLTNSVPSLTLNCVNVIPTCNMESEEQPRPDNERASAEVAASPSDLHTILAAVDALAPLKQGKSNYGMLVPDCFETRDGTKVYIKRSITPDEAVSELSVFSPAALRAGAEIEAPARGTIRHFELRKRGSELSGVQLADLSAGELRGPADGAGTPYPLMSTEASWLVELLRGARKLGKADPQQDRAA